MCPLNENVITANFMYKMNNHGQNLVNAKINHYASYPLCYLSINLSNHYFDRWISMLWKCRHTSNIPLAFLWPPIHWFINSIMVTINPLGLLTSWIVTTGKSIHHSSHLCSIKMTFALVRRKNKRTDHTATFLHYFLDAREQGMKHCLDVNGL